MVNFGGGQLWRWSRGGCGGRLPPALMFGPEVETEVEPEVGRRPAGRPAGRPPPGGVIMTPYIPYIINQSNHSDVEKTSAGIASQVNLVSGQPGRWSTRGVVNQAGGYRYNY